MSLEKKIVNPRYINTLNIKSSFVVKKHTKNLNDTCIKASNHKALSHDSLFGYKMFCLRINKLICVDQNMTQIDQLTHNIHYLTITKVPTFRQHH